MNGNGYEAYELELDDLEDVADFEYDDELAFLEDDEARRGRRGRRGSRSRGRRGRGGRGSVSTGRGRGYYNQPASRNPVSQSQYKEALDKISKDVRTNAAGIKANSGRIDAVSSALKSHAAKTDRELDGLKNGIQMASILPLITSKKVTVPAAASETVFGKALKEDTQVQVAPSGIQTVLPLLLTSGDFGGGGNNSMVFLALALSGAL